METNQIETVWISGKNGVEEVLRIANVKGDGFAFGKDDLMKICLFFADANLKTISAIKAPRSKSETNGNAFSILSTKQEKL